MLKAFWIIILYSKSEYAMAPLILYFCLYLYGLFVMWSLDGPFFIAFVLAAALMMLSFIDNREKRLPNIGVMFVGVLGVIYHLIERNDLLYPLTAMVIAFACLFTLSHAFYKLRGVVGLGMGDVKLFAVGAIWVPMELLPMVLMIASFLALLSIVLFQLMSKLKKEEINIRQVKFPFGPHLALGIWLCWVFNIELKILLGL